MARAFTIYWKPEGWAGIGEGNPIGRAGGTGFVGKVEPGSRVYVTNVLKGELRLLGAFTVRQAGRSTRAEASWGPEFLLAEEGSSTSLQIRPVSLDVARKLRFVTRSGRETAVAFKEDGAVDGQAMRAIRELTPESALHLDKLLASQAVFELVHYAIAARARIESALAAGGRGVLEQGGNWDKARHHLATALSAGERLPLLIGDAGYIIGAEWVAEIERIDAAPEGRTRIHYRGLRELPVPIPRSELIKMSDNQPISESFLHGNVACRVPAKLLQQPLDANPIANAPRASKAIPKELDRDSKVESEWTESELRASVASYLDMARRVREGKPVVKKQYYRDLAAQIGRSEKSCEYRMQNISYVLALMGRDWIKGLPPAKNVGAKVAAQIERLIGEIEGRSEAPRAGEALTVAKARKTLQERPKGSKAPATTSATTTGFVRDAQVKAWVLERAKGSCEACTQPAPFSGADGFPFLEVHHVRRLADGGSDTVTNAVALCPNCHRRLHFSEDAQTYCESLFGKVKELVRE